MKTRTVTTNEFNRQYGPQAKRIWNHENETGIGFNQLEAAPFGINDLSYAFVRNDGWTILATPEGAETCRQLWPDEWREVVVKRNN